MKRWAFGIALAAVTVAAVISPSLRSDDRSAPLTVPDLTGPYAVGTIVTQAVDAKRRVSFAPRGAVRKVRIQIWYPAVADGTDPRAPYMPKAVAAAVAHESRLSARPLAGVRSNARSGARVARGRFPVIAFSPGYRVPSALYTGLLEDLASQGFIVAAVDHTYETIAVQLGGRIVRAALPARAPSDAKTIFEMIRARKADARLVRRALARINRSTLSGAADLTRIGIFGHSLGGLTAAHLVADGESTRFTCGADLDGSVYGLRTTVHRPFLIFTESTRDGTLGHFWRALKGERHWFLLHGTRHLNFSDWTWLYLELRLGARRSPVAKLIGPIGGTRALAIERAYLAAFFASCLRDESSGLLDGTSRPYPEVTRAR